MDSILEKAFQSQFNFERYSADVYEALSKKLDWLNLVGMASYLKKRGDEERGHAEKFAQFLSDRNVLTILDALPKPPIPETNSIFEIGETAFRNALEHEKLVTSRLEMLYKLAQTENDGQAEIFLQWFLTEQLEEEKTLEEILTKFELARGNGAAILEIDGDLGGD